MHTAYSYIRFSSKPQERGDSLRRQTKLARDYAEKHGLLLDERSYQDLGISAFKGKNSLEGALAAFIKAVDEGLIQKGSYLLVESMDRLSRQDVDEALELFLGITRRGITLVTLLDGQVYNSANIKANWTLLIWALANMARANDESSTKSSRVKAAWDEKAKSGRIMTAMGPAWLEVNANKTAWVLKPDKVDIVQRVFAMAAGGIGAPTIALRLNEQDTPTMQKAPYWEPGVVMALLKNRAVLGDLVRRKAGGAPIPNYYPEIIKPDVFHQVQEHIAGRRGSGGRKGNNVANLFVGLLRCECGARMRYVSGAKPHLYLKCLTSYNKQGCDAPGLPYNQLEESIMSFVIDNSEVKADPTKEIDPSVALRGQLQDKVRQRDNLIKVISEAAEVAAPAFLLQQAQKLEAEVLALERQLRLAGTPTPLGTGVSKTMLAWSEHAKAVKAGGTELYDLRLRLQAEIKRLLSKIVMRKRIHGADVEDSPNPRPYAEWAEAVVYGPFADLVNRTFYGKGPLPDDEYTTSDGGVILEYWLPEWGINGTRRRVKTTNLHT